MSIRPCKLSDGFVDMDKRSLSLREVTVAQLVIFFFLQIPALTLLILGIVFAPSITADGTMITVLRVVFSILAYISLRMLVMGCIYMYKAFAPVGVRGRCRYTPTCSSYTLISVKRYGIIIGLSIGLLRIHRCRPPFCGEDYPSIKHLSRFVRSMKKDADAIMQDVEDGDSSSED